MLHPSYRAILAQVMVPLLIYPGTALAEVSDKEPTTTLFWTIGIGAGLLCFFGTRIKPWLGIIFLVPAVLWFTSLFWRSTPLTSVPLCDMRKVLSIIGKRMQHLARYCADSFSDMPGASGYLPERAQLVVPLSTCR